MPPEYPFKPPHIIFLTPSGRFETNTKVCLSFSAYHPELWQPAWGIRLILEALIAFLPTPADGAIGSLDWTSKERKRLALSSQKWSCPTCGPIGQLLPELKKEEDGDGTKKCKKATTNFAKEIQELQRLQLETEGMKNQENKGETTQEEENGKKEDGESVKETEVKEGSDGNHEASGGSGVVTGGDTPPTSPAPAPAAAPTVVDNTDSSTVTTQSPTGGTAATAPSPAAPSTNGQLKAVAATTPAAQTSQQEHTPPPVPAGNVAQRPPVVANRQEQPAAAAAADDANDNNNNDMTWMIDPLLNIMIVVLALICYLFLHKFQALWSELEEIRQWELQVEHDELLQKEIEASLNSAQT